MATEAVHDAPATETSGVTSEQAWRALTKASFAVISHVTPSGEPRSSGVGYKIVGRRMYVGIAPNGWKARHIPASGRVAVTATVRRGGIMSLVFPIPPATISFHGAAIVHAAGSPALLPVLDDLGSLIPPEMRDHASVIEIVPEGSFLTYGIGVSLKKMRDPKAARAHAPV